MSDGDDDLRKHRRSRTTPPLLSENGDLQRIHDNWLNTGTCDSQGTGGVGGAVRLSVANFGGLLSAASPYSSTSPGFFSSSASSPVPPHYRSRLLCRGPQALGKASKVLGEVFAECSSRRGKAPSAKIRSAKASLPRAVYRTLGKAFAESPTLGKARNKKMRKKNLEKNFQSGEGPTGQRPPVFGEVASRGIFCAKFTATRSAGFELVTSHSRDTSSATCTTHSHASI
jgi:hypothetical protein